MASRLLLGSLLVVATSGTLSSQEEPFETRVYSVQFLTQVIEDWPGTPLGLLDAVPTVTTSEEPTGFLDGETLVGLIRNNVAEESWDHDSARMEIAEGILTVTNRKSVHQKISEYLSYWRALLARMIAVDAIFLRVTPSTLTRIRAGGAPDRPAAVSAEQLRQFLAAAREGQGAEIVGSMRVVARNGQRVSLQQATHGNYVRDYDCQVSTGSAAPDAILGQYALGTTLDVRPILEPFGNAVTVEIRGAVADSEGIEERTLKIQIGLGTGTPTQDSKGDTAVVPKGGLQGVPCELKLHHPKVALEEIRTTVTLRDRETFLVGLTYRKDRNLVLLVTPSILLLEGKPPVEPKFEEERLLRVYDISPLTRSVLDFPGPKLDLAPPSNTTSLTGATFTSEEPGGMKISNSDVADMIRRLIAPDTWANKRNFITQTARGALVVRQKPQVLQEIDRYLTSLLPSRAVMVTTEALLFGFRKGARAEWEKEIPALSQGGYFVDAEKIDRLLAEAEKGGKVRLLERAETTGFPQQRVCATRVRQETYVADYDPQIASLASGVEPVVSFLQTGFVLDVRPSFVSGTDTIALDLRSSAADREMREVESLATQFGYLQLPQVSGQRWNQSLICTKDKYVVVGVESRKLGDDTEEMVLFVRARANVLK